MARERTKKENLASLFVLVAIRCVFFVSLCAFLWLTNCAASAQTKADRKTLDPSRFESEIAAFEKWDRQNAFPKDPILFVGSSSIRLWQTAEAFPDAPVINRGFGGSTIADVNHYFDRVVAKYKPRAIIFYAGDNDIAGGKLPQHVYEDFLEFVRLVHQRLAQTPIYFISIKPSIARQKLWSTMKEANSLIEKLAGHDKQVIFVDIATPMLAGHDVPAKDLFLDDGLHLNAKGYNLWNEALSETIDALHQRKQAGIGAAFRIEDGKVFVTKVLPESPAAQSNLIHENDQLIAVAEGSAEPIDVVSTEDVARIVGMIRGPVGTVVRLTIIPEGMDNTDQLVASLIRGNIKEIDLFIDGHLLPLGTKAPNFTFARLSDAEQRDLSQLAGRAVVIDFWASWCGPCIQTVDELSSLHEQYPGWTGQIEFLAVSVDDRKDDAVTLFKTKFWSKISTVWAGPEVLKLYRVAGLPTMLVVDQDGVIVAVGHRLNIPSVVKPLLP